MACHFSNFLYFSVRKNARQTNDWNQTSSLKKAPQNPEISKVVSDFYFLFANPRVGYPPLFTVRFHG